MLGVWLFACTTSAPNWSQELAKDPQQTKEKILALEELERISLVMGLIEKQPQHAATLCSTLKDTSAHARCINISNRPHLWSEPKQTQTQTSTQSTQEKSGCEEGPLFLSCIEEKTKNAIRRGDIEGVKQLCRGIKREKWLSECLFRAAEQATLHRGSHGYSEGVELCFAAGAFSENCQNHLIMMLAKRAPTAQAAQKEAWAPIESASNAIRAAWSWRDRALQQKYQERLWSEALGMAYSGTRPVTGEPLDILSAAHRPHVHSGLTRRLLKIDPPHTHNLATWVELAERCLAARASKKHDRDVESRFQAAADLWEEGPEESISYMATSRRLYSSDAYIDLHIAVLEAAARMPPAHMPLLEEGKAHPHPLVQSTALRLIQKIQAEE